MVKEETKRKKIQEFLPSIPLLSYLVLWGKTEEKGIKTWEKKKPQNSKDQKHTHRDRVLTDIQKHMQRNIH